MTCPAETNSLCQNTINQDQKAWSFIKQYNIANSDKTAIKDGSFAYTYEDIFKHWESYAKVFTALGMTGARKARAGLLGSTSAETVFAFYGLNMVGAQISMLGTPFSFSQKKIISAIENEKLTDLILTDDFAQPKIIFDLLMKKQSLGLNNIIMHIPAAGGTVDKMMTYGQEYKYAYMKQWLSPVCMDTLIAQYANTQIDYAENVSDDHCVYVHTSGTTSGMGKPVPLSDKALNIMGTIYDTYESFSFLKKDLVSAVTIDLSNSYALVNQMHALLAVGGTMANVPFGPFNPLLYKAVPEFKVSLLLCTSALLDMWEKQENASMDFSSLKCVIIGGAAVSAHDKRRHYDFLCRHGGKDIVFINGYGLSELSGACILSTPDLDDESVGYPLPGVEVCLYSEDDGKYFTMEDIPCQGVLYLRSDAMTCGTIDGRETVKTEEINGKRYVCSNDVVSIDETGKIWFKGRANRYFINSEGRKYDAGRVENEISRQKDIEGCCVAPVYIKLMHDNFPMLCVKPRCEGYAAAETVRLMLIKVFAIDKALEPDQLPERVLIADELPRNANGKIDLFKISSGEVKGMQYRVQAVRVNDEIKDILFIPIANEEDDMMHDVMESMAKDIMDSGVGFGANSAGKNVCDWFSGAAGNFAQPGRQTQGAMNGASQYPNYAAMFGMPQYSNPYVQQIKQMMYTDANRMYLMARYFLDAAYQYNIQFIENFSNNK